MKPLAERMRPQTLDGFFGQDHLVGTSGSIRLALKAGVMPSIILWGPPGVGKTTLALLIANNIQAKFFQLSAISAGVKEVREVIQQAKFEKKALLFLDEIHRFSKSQQDALLGAVEQGVITLIGATTENPSFEVNNALLSRSQVYVLNALSAYELIALAEKALKEDKVLSQYKVEIKESEWLVRLSDGDARRLLNLLENIVTRQEKGKKIVVDDALVKDIARNTVVSFDKKGDWHYDVVSAFIKSIRGSDPNGAVYWLARMIEAGEDPKFIARRLIISASEDIGLANPTALVIANNCFQAIETIGMPEGRIVLSQTTIYLANSPKSNSAYMAINQALGKVKQTGNAQVPLHLRGAYTSLNKSLGYGKGYKYTHDFPGNFTQQEYLPDQLKSELFYDPGQNPREVEYRKRLSHLWKGKYKY